MQAQHLDALARLEAMCFSKPWSRDSLASELENPVAVFFVAQADGAAVGYAGMHHVVDEGYIDNIAVHPLYRRRGAANALLARLDRYAVKNGLAFLTLEVRRSNKEAQRLYARNGFVKAGERRDFYVAPPEDAVIMTKYYADTPDGERIGSQTNE
ncbi:MAG: ribosomal protein S18-alanine N-acetyltransferase [Clostridia bacterium]|nr:ribosomal protein S18-alanine N-acetyltransferase [Clostridia bacterium]